MRSPIYTILVLLIASVSTLAAVPAAPTGSATSGYPDKAEITKIFTSFTEGDYPGFFSHLAPNFTWTMMGTHPLAGQYHNVTIFADNTLLRLGNVLRTSPAPSTKLLNVIGGNSEWSVQEVYGTGVCKNGLKYDNRFAWVTRWNTRGEIAEVRSYFDSALVERALRENESPDYTYTDQRNTLVEGPVGLNCRS
ncbi:hypothetical protein DTO164E3_8129 [Paecilomyces variotii]|nr:hypothetical protein DTO164E3_8129 [Paecilomyces variotii]KAJ9226814.1 hypothetical protein DTO169C6_1054 [Paecilomyces variotii]KAJ9327462.1 hypothetical protein DTO027B3_1684 [Paecilomyces variotii]KAJ9334992.1 hypothetical protein DTO027B5_3209 [Paecilomyces variotii]KAJ9406420.1 hypothetical protein DTO045G8_5809 [Paecilomyces variotii]